MPGAARELMVVSQGKATALLSALLAGLHLPGRQRAEGQERIDSFAVASESRSAMSNLSAL
jgi:hypothetical protein